MEPSRFFTQSSARITQSAHSDYVRTLICYAAPDFILCPSASDECMVNCLGGSIGSGHLEIERIKSKSGPIWNARMERRAVMKRWIDNGRMGKEDTDAFTKYLKRIAKTYKVAVRINGTSDICPSVFLELMNRLPEVSFYDYTKSEKNLIVTDALKVPNYHLTFSYSGSVLNYESCQKALGMGYNVAVVFGTKDPSRFPKTFMGYPVINGDETEYRPSDPKGVIVGLTVRGNRIWKNYKSGTIKQFIVPCEEEPA
jgi:hypothetical protein